MPIQPPILPPTDGGTDSPREVQKPRDTPSRPVDPMPDDGTKKPPFREVLNKKLLEKEIKQPLVPVTDDEDDDDEQVSLLDLVAASSARDLKPKSSLDEKVAFTGNNQGDDIVVALTDDTSDVKPLYTPAEATTKPLFKTADESAAPKLDKEPVVVDPHTGKPLEKVVVKEADKVVVSTDSKDEIKDKKVEDITAPKAKDVIAQAPQVVVQNVAPVEVNKLADQPTRAREVLLQLAQQMVEKIQKVTSPGRTDTTLLLNHPPLFAGVSLRITEFDTSKKQFNVTFFDLKDPTARMLVELPDNQLKLQQALLDRGYTLQMITIEQKIPGLASTDSGEVLLKDKPDQDGQAGTATDKEDQKPS